ncbi:MAG: 13E12 repeat family protein, partial [Bifidobacteriaceae bacterium]|nr:13E12 repeat family protein [Bifidobacteriaceae bacterium]
MTTGTGDHRREPGWTVPGVGVTGRGRDGQAGGEGREAPAGVGVLASDVSPELARIGLLLSRYWARERRLDPDRTRLADTEALIGLGGRLEAAGCLALAEADAAGAAERVVGAKASTWLTWDRRHTLKQARALTARGARLRRFEATGKAVVAGWAIPAQGERIVSELAGSAEVLPPWRLTELEAGLLGDAERFDSAYLSARARRRVEELAPGEVEAREAARVERDHKLSLARRELRLMEDRHGSVTIRGRLPIADGLLLRETVEAYANQARLSHNGWDQDSDPQARRPSKAQLMADGLVAAAERAAQAPGGPTLGGAQPKLVVSCGLEILKAGVNDAALEDAETGRPVTAGELRRLACSAGVVPWVMGAVSEVVDWGKTRRLAPPGLREALAARD